MAQGTGELNTPARVGLPRGRSRWRRGLRLLAEQPLGALGLAIFLILVALAVFAPVIAPHHPTLQDIPNRFASPSREHFFGTDHLGRDLFSRIVYGSRTSLFVGIGTVAIGTSLGTVIGLVSAYYRRVDFILQRLVDALLAIPLFILAVAVVAMLGPNMTNTVIALAIAFIPNTARVMRAQALSIQQRPFIEAARAAGANDLRILVRHLAPNCFAPYIILASTGLAVAILAEAGLSFLGLGTPPPRPSWGHMLSGSAQQFALTAPWLAVFPGLAITIVVLGFSLFGDALRDVLDPRLRGSR
jgi:peptide/nickel transport system permease protein